MPASHRHIQPPLPGHRQFGGRRSNTDASQGAPQALSVQGRATAAKRARLMELFERSGRAVRDAEWLVEAVCFQEGQVRTDAYEVLAMHRRERAGLADRIVDLTGEYE